MLALRHDRCAGPMSETASGIGPHHQYRLDPTTKPASSVPWTDLGLYFGLIIGLIVVLARDDIVPANFKLDSQKIQAIAAGITPSYGDLTFQNVASVYRFLGLAATHSADVVAIGGFVIGSVVIFFATARAGHKVGGPLEFALVAAVFLLNAAYLGNYSKDVFVVPLVALVLLSSRAVKWDILILVAISIYAIEFRQYWLIVGAAYVIFRFLTKTRVRIRTVLFFGVLGAVTCGFLLAIFTGVSPDHFRTVVSDTRTTSAATEIAPLVNLQQPVGGLVNIAITYFALILPIPLIFKAGLGYLPVVAIFALIWLLVIRRISDFGDWAGLAPERRATLSRAVSLLFSFLLVQSLFEPDYGSALRHLTPLLPLCVYIVLAVIQPRGGRSRAATFGS